MLLDVVRSAVVLFGVLTAFAYVTLLERRLLARFQLRIGPNRVAASAPIVITPTYSPK